jgi:hypothetical protein
MRSVWHDPLFHSFEEFRDHLLETVERMNSGLEDPEATWPGVLFLEVPEQGLVVGEIVPLTGLSDLGKRDLATYYLPLRIRTSKADRFAWLMPGHRHDVEPEVECLVVVLGEVGYTEAFVVDVLRGRGRPVLGEWRGPTKTVTGLFADPLARALLAKRRPTTRKRKSSGRAPKSRYLRVVSSGGQSTVVPTEAPQRDCPGCGAVVGEPHRPRCDVEPCSACLQQRLMCDCPDHDPLAVAWDGEWPGATECRSRGWWAVRTGSGWRPCPPGTPGAIEDVNRLTVFRETGQDCLYDELS